MTKLYRNPDNTHVRLILDNIEKKGGSCCCQPIKSKDSMCPFTYESLPKEIEVTELCGNGIIEGECICGLFVKPS